MRLPLGISDHERGIAETAAIRVVNRYFESDPTETEGNVALLARPGVRKWLTLATSPVRAVYSQPGTFDESLFAVGGTKVYKIEQDETVTEIGTLTSSTGAVSMAATDTILYIADGLALYSYDGATFAAVTVPDGDGVVSVGVIASFVICVVAQGQDKNGRFYWIEPGETAIDPLNFATAERSPDPVWNVVIRGDQFWLPGSGTIEVWGVTGDDAAPFIRQQGRLFERGAWEGTVLPIGESMMLVDSAGEVWDVTDAPNKVSTPGISQRLREAINAQRAA